MDPTEASDADRTITEALALAANSGRLRESASQNDRIGDHQGAALLRKMASADLATATSSLAALCIRERMRGAL